MHEHVRKHVKINRKPMGGAKKHGKHSIAWSEKGERYAWSEKGERYAWSKKGERYAWSSQHHGDVSQMVTSKQGLTGVECNHTTTNPLRESSMAKPRTREANMEDKT